MLVEMECIGLEFGDAGCARFGWGMTFDRLLFEGVWSWASGPGWAVPGTTAAERLPGVQGSFAIAGVEWAGRLEGEMRA